MFVAAVDAQECSQGPFALRRALRIPWIERRTACRSVRSDRQHTNICSSDRTGPIAVGLTLDLKGQRECWNQVDSIGSEPVARKRVGVRFPPPALQGSGRARSCCRRRGSEASRGGRPRASPGSLSARTTRRHRSRLARWQTASPLAESLARREHPAPVSSVRSGPARVPRSSPGLRLCPRALPRRRLDQPRPPRRLPTADHSRPEVPGDRLRGKACS
jgi:hypothetical protein